ncbi:flavin reductase [Nocardioides hwasunensis]|uniref:Flavin reductase n=1 Tax=Nocardioides hwasunensis TaxID=397258 RepID=A0ABR8MG48_9ACTN|nr:flavin reductase [Nocardioides hwasunensis]MBD3915057.1 flavin reductase [Nocardioides hwasunensis]
MSATPSAGEVDFDSAQFRKVLGRFPTGVVVVTAISASGEPVGMTVGSFTSVSLDPPLVGFLPDRSSSSFPRIREASRFCVNVLSADQAPVCRQFAAKGADKFQGLGWTPGPRTGAPVLSGSVAWIECDLHSVTDAGDHYFVLGDVLGIGAGHEQLPLLFFQGGYGRFSSLSMAAWDEAGLLEPLQATTVGRSVMEALAAELDMEVLAMVLRGEEMIVVSSAGNSFREHGVTSRVGARVPLVPPMGSYVVAWDEVAAGDWLDRAERSVGSRAEAENVLQRVRDRGWSLGLMSERQVAFDIAVSNASVANPTDEQREALDRSIADIRLEDTEPEVVSPDRTYAIRHIGAPVFAPDGGVLFALNAFGYRSLAGHEIAIMSQRIVAAANRISALVAETLPLVRREFEPRVTEASVTVDTSHHAQ